MKFNVLRLKHFNFLLLSSLIIATIWSASGVAQVNQLAWIDCGGLKVNLLRTPPKLTFLKSDVNAFSSSRMQGSVGSSPLCYAFPLTKQMSGSQFSYVGSVENDAGHSSSAIITSTGENTATASYYNVNNGQTSNYTCKMIHLSESDFYQERLIESTCQGDIEDMSTLLGLLTDFI